MKRRTLKIETRQTVDLIPYAANARTHTEAQVAMIAGSIRRFGWTNPVLVDGENGIIAGHGRVLAAQKLGVAEVPVIELADLSEADRRAYIIADNRLAELAGGTTPCSPQSLARCATWASRSGRSASRRTTCRNCSGTFPATTGARATTVPTGSSTG